MRNGLDYDHYKVYVLGTLDDFKSDDLSQYLDKVSKHLYGKFYQDYILFEKGFQLLGKDSINEVLQETNYENSLVSGYVEDCKKFYLRKHKNRFNNNDTKRVVLNKVFDERLYHNSKMMEDYKELDYSLVKIERIS